MSIQYFPTVSHRKVEMPHSQSHGPDPWSPSDGWMNTILLQQ